MNSFIIEGRYREGKSAADVKSLNSKPSLLYSSFIIISLILSSLFFNNAIITVEASSLADIEIHANRLVQIELDGSVIVEDSFKLSANVGGGELAHFTVGLPCKLRSKIFNVSAYDAHGEPLSYTLDYDLDGFY